MKTKTTILFFIAFLLAQLNAQTNRFLTQIDNCLEAQNEQLPFEKIYLHTDRTFYAPGETIWFKTYLTDAKNQYLKSKSQVAYVQLVSPSGTTLQQLVLNNQNGTLAGDFQLPKTYAGGIYKIQAYTNWLGNFTEEAIFEKEITIQKVVLPKLLMKLEFEKEAYGEGAKVAAILKIRDLQDKAIVNHTVDFSATIQGSSTIVGTAKTDNTGEAIVQFSLPEKLNSADGLLNIIVQHGGFTESISRSIPIVLQNIDLQFFAEGGDLVAGFSNQIAFKALDEFGKPADVSGIILNENGATVSTFKTFHDGMGVTSLTPRLQQKLTAKITEPKGIETIFKLPEINQDALGASLKSEDDEELRLSIFSKKETPVLVTLRMHEQVYFSKKVDLKKGENESFFSTKALPVGVAEVTIFNQKNEPKWERLAFVNHERELKIEVKPDKESYQPRDRVALNISVKDETGKGVQGNFSLAVVDDKLHSFADDKQPNIMAQLLVQSELRGEIHEPNFYFDRQEEKAEKALDLVMLTHGWRQFMWEEILTNSEKDWERKVQYQAEELAISGKVTLNYQPIANAKVWTTDKNNYVKTDAQGFFILPKKGTEINAPIHVGYKRLKGENTVHHFSQAVIGERFQVGSPMQNQVDVLTEIYEAEEDVMVEEVAVKLEKTAERVALNRQKEMKKMKDIQLDEVVVTAYQVPLVEQDNTTQGMTLSSVAYKRRTPVNVYSLTSDVSLPVLKLSINMRSLRNYHRPRRYYAPNYSRPRNPQVARSDFRKTLFWNANLSLNAQGETVAYLFASDEISTFRVIIEGIGEGGKVAHAESTFSVNMPFAIHTKIPKVVTFGDKMRLPITLKNSTDKAISGKLKTTLSNTAFSILEENKNTLTIPANSYLETEILLQTGAEIGEFPVQLAFEAVGFKDEIREVIEVTPKGFPRSISIGGKEKERAFSFDIDDYISGSLQANFVAFPDVTAELMSGVESMLREPGGCFEQTSSSSYPNTLVLQYLDNQQIVNVELRKRAVGYLERGYKRLVGYEIEGGGFSLFGQVPADPLITAYGLLQFNDLRKVWNGVDEAMMKRAETWLFSALKKMNMTGSVDDAYFLYALSESGYKSFGNNLKVVNDNALKTKSPYLLALACHLNLNIGNDEIAAKMLDVLLKNFQADKFAAPAAAPSLSHSRGTARSLEITALVARALIQIRGNTVELMPLIDQLNQARKNGGRFGNTQTTIQCLKTMNDYAAVMSTMKSGGNLELAINGKMMETLNYEAGHQGKIEFNDLGQYLVKGKNLMQIRFQNTKHPLPYVFDVYWKNNTPDSNPDLILKITTSLSNTTVKSGETTRLSATISNTTNEEVYAPMALIGIPAGLSLQPWQLKDMLEKQAFDYYELRGNYLIAYFKNFEKREIRTLNFDLKADIPGEYLAPASVTYPYYFEEAKDWVKGEAVTIQ